MNRVVRILAAAGFAATFFPTQAYAAEGVSTTVPWIRGVVGLVGVAVAALLLVETLSVRRVAAGGAIVEKISLVVLAIVCLAGSALVHWVGRFLAILPTGQEQLMSEVLVIAAMGLLGAYFYSVRSAMQGYLDAMTGEELLAVELSEKFGSNGHSLDDEAGRSASDTEDAAGG